jgi:hypothetical protein
LLCQKELWGSEAETNKLADDFLSRVAMCDQVVSSRKDVLQQTWK